MGYNSYTVVQIQGGTLTGFECAFCGATVSVVTWEVSEDKKVTILHPTRPKRVFCPRCETLVEPDWHKIDNSINSLKQEDSN